ncbi:rod shape-determining protein MreD [Agrilactobacillus yilanensis]|uniref:Rod shape-determining protein MreD n=1 Tax=Agrilactobacillus yilanensis TaxID=2485997 RepID=A0ABW4J855_9LACO|nr:rod shape-determining protein MreD [Agrilactobacillus yilanensis]
MTRITNNRLKWLIPIIWVVLFLLDGVISVTFQGWLFNYPWSVSIQAFLIGIVMTTYRFPEQRWLLWTALVIGLFYDSFYSGIIGYYTFLMPAAVLFVRWVTNYLPNSALFQATVYILVLIGLEFSLYILNGFFGASTDFALFITYNLGPTVAVNTVLFAALYYPYSKLLGKISV